jgi:hypothetical protein
MQYPDKNEAGRFFEQLIPRLANISGVEAAGATTSLPASGSTSHIAVVVEGDTDRSRRTTHGWQTPPSSPRFPAGV